MDINKLRNHSVLTRKTAEKLLKDNQLKEVLSRCGDVFVGGSYALNLMYGPDIDVIVECTDPRSSSVMVLKDLIDKRQFQKYEYGDFVKHPRENRPRGYIVNLIQTFDNRKWEFEIWFLERGIKSESDNIKEIVSKLTPEKKDLILKIKHQREENNISKHRLSSKQIYKEVLKNNANDIADIIKF